MLFFCGLVLISHPSCKACIFCQTQVARALVSALAGPTHARPARAASVPGLSDPAMQGSQLAGQGAGTGSSGGLAASLRVGIKSTVSGPPKGTKVSTQSIVAVRSCAGPVRVLHAVQVSGPHSPGPLARTDDRACCGPCAKPRVAAPCASYPPERKVEKASHGARARARRDHAALRTIRALREEPRGPLAQRRVRRLLPQRRG